ncbi:Uncharacterised protein [Mycobacterium tuberculosis]|nr:Uncharacterised protein [Mycobacterium tuberculosis]
MVRPRVAGTVGFLDGLAPDHLGVDADDHGVPAAQILLEGGHAGGDSGGCGVVLVGDNGVDAVMRQQRRYVGHAGTHSRVRVLGVGRLCVDGPGVHDAGCRLGHFDDGALGRLPAGHLTDHVRGRHQDAVVVCLLAPVLGGGCRVAIHGARRCVGGAGQSQCNGTGGQREGGGLEGGGDFAGRHRRSFSRSAMRSGC